LVVARAVPRRVALTDVDGLVLGDALRARFALPGFDIGTAGENRVRSRGELRILVRGRRHRAVRTRPGEVTVKLAEALAQRADAQRRVEQLRARAVGSARYQEGEKPAEDAARLIAEAEATLDLLQSLTARVNRTNCAVRMGADGTLTDALARRDALRARHALVTAAADAAAGRDQRGAPVRQLRSELAMLPALPVPRLRERADTLAREICELDLRIQRVNWEADLLD
jgi:hypothetical protein